MSLFGTDDSALTTGSTNRGVQNGGAAVAATLKDVRRVRAKQGRKDAYEATARAVAAHPKADLILQERALLALELGRAREAEDLLRKVAQGPKADWRTYSALGAALASQKRHADAIKALRRALKSQPDNPTILNNLAMAHALDGQIEKAEQLLTTAATKAAGRRGSERIQQNRALLAGLSGRIKDFKAIVRDRLPAEDVKMNTALLSDRKVVKRSVRSSSPRKFETSTKSAKKGNKTVQISSQTSVQEKSSGAQGATSASLLSEPVKSAPLTVVSGKSALSGRASLGGR